MVRAQPELHQANDFLATRIRGKTLEPRRQIVDLRQHGTLANHQVANTLFFDVAVLGMLQPDFVKPQRDGIVPVPMDTDRHHFGRRKVAVIENPTRTRETGDLAERPAGHLDFPRGNGRRRPDRSPLDGARGGLFPAGRGLTQVAVSPDNALIVQSDCSVLLEVHAPRAEEARAALAPFAELVKSPEHVHTYRLTPLSIWNARAAGLCAPKMVAALREHARYPVPATVEILSWRADREGDFPHLELFRARSWGSHHLR